MEEFTIPFLHDSGSPVDSEREKAEVLAKAFNDSAGAYFPEYNRLGDEIKSAKNKFYACLVITILFVVGAILTEFFIIGIIGGLILAGVTYYFFNKRNKKEKERKELKPAEDISFLSKLYLPVYIVPYSNEKSIVFDGRRMGDSVRVELENYDMDSLMPSFRALNQAHDAYYDLIEDNSLLSPTTVADNSQEKAESKILEKNLLNVLDNVYHSSKPETWHKRTFELFAHRPESDFTRDLHHLYNFKEHAEIEDDSQIPLFDLYVGPEEATESVSELKGMEVKASSADVLDKTEEWRDWISTAIKEIENRLEYNIDVSETNYDVLNSLSLSLMNVQVCPECFSYLESDNSGPTKGQEIESYYNLEEYILNEFETPIKNMDDNIRCEECNTIVEAIDKEMVHCPECNSETIKYKSPQGSPRNRAEKYITNNINVTLEDMPMEYIFNLPICSFEDGKWYCDKHGEVEPINLPAFGDVLGHTADNAWDEMKEPVKERCTEAKKEAMNYVTEHRSQMLQLAPYEQTEMEIESLIAQLNSDIRAAETAMQKLGWAVNKQGASQDKATEEKDLAEVMDDLGLT